MRSFVRSLLRIREMTFVLDWFSDLRQKNWHFESILFPFLDWKSFLSIGVRTCYGDLENFWEMPWKRFQFGNLKFLWIMKSLWLSFCRRMFQTNWPMSHLLTDHCQTNSLVSFFDLSFITDRLHNRFVNLTQLMFWRRIVEICFE